jgi:hypothetical protein
LLGAVVQVPFEPAAGIVAGRHDPGPRRGELGARLSVGDRGRHQIRKVANPRLDVGR